MVAAMLREVLVADDVAQAVDDLAAHPACRRVREGRARLVDGRFHGHRHAGRSSRRDLVRLGRVDGVDGRSGATSADDVARLLADRDDQGSRSEIADRVDEDGDRRRQQRDDPAADRLAEDLRRDWLIWSLELPSTSSSRSRMVGR